MNRFVEVRDGFIEAAIKDYARLTPKEVARARRLTAGLPAKRVLHVNATPIGGGVVEILRSQIPLERSLGIDSRWLVIEAEPAFFVITKKIHNLFQGKPGKLTARERATYLRVNRDLAKSLQEFMAKAGMNEGILLIHDPQPLATMDFLKLPKAVSPVLRLHIDFTTANPDVARFFKPHIKKYDRLVISSRNYLPAFKWFPRRRIDIIQPAIDPLCDKNRPVSRAQALKLMARYGIDGRRPIMTQVSRFDPWKGPLGVVEAYRAVKREVPDLQLIMVGFMFAKDDPEAASIYAQVERLVGRDPDVHLFSDPKQLRGTTNDDFINALLTVSTVIVQNSSREGFGLTMTEAMWHAKPFIAARSAGSKLQVTNGKNGIIIPPEAPKRLAVEVLKLLRDQKLGKRLGTAARKSVQDKFLLSRYVRENLDVYRAALKG